MCENRTDVTCLEDREVGQVPGQDCQGPGGRRGGLVAVVAPPRGVPLTAQKTR